MQSNYVDLKQNFASLFHPTVVTEEDIFALKSLYVPTPNIAPSEDFSKEQMANVPTMAWMKDHNFVLIAQNKPENTYGTDIQVFNSPLEWFKTIEDQCSIFPWYKLNQKLVAFDLETTGLNTNFRVHGGQLNRFDTIVGLCLAVDGTTGYYLPLLHTEDDGVKNWSFNEIRELIDYLTDDSKFILTLHNASYDFSMLRAHGMRIPKTCNDTLLLSKLMNNYEFFPFHIKDGLKQLSEFVLKRKMIEIHEFFGSKSNVQFNLLSATTATVYASSDAINSLDLYHAFVTKDEFGRSPWHNQLLNTKVVMGMIYAVTSQSAQGVPIDYEHAMSTLKTTIRRAILLERRWATIMENHGAEFKITSNEQANMFVGNLLRKHYFGDPSTFDVWATEAFGTKIKHVTVGKGDQERQKTTYGMDESVISLIVKNIDSFDYPKNIKQEIKDVLEIVSLYRSLTHDIPMYTGLIRCSFRDDRGYVMGNASTRLEGTDTGRSSSSKASGPTMAYVTYGKMKTKVEVTTKNDGNILSVNSQGMPSTSFYLNKAKEVINLHPHILEQLNQLTNEVESRLKMLLRNA